MKKARILIEGYSPEYCNQVGKISQRNEDGNLLLEMDDGTIIGVHEEFVEIIE